MTKYLGGAALAALIFLTSNLFSPRATAQNGEGLPSIPRVGDRLYVQGQVQMGCTVSQVHANWVLCDGVWRNLVTGAAYMVQQRAK